MPSRSVLLAAVAATVTSLAAPAHAGSIEDAFRGYLDKLRSKGQQLIGRSEAPVATKPKLVKRTDTLPLGRAEFAIFVSPGCGRCDDAVEALRKRDVNVEVLDLSKSETAREAFALTKAKRIPALMVGNQLLIGWDEKLYKQAIKNDAIEKNQSVTGGGA